MGIRVGSKDWLCLRVAALAGGSGWRRYNALQIIDHTSWGCYSIQKVTGALKENLPEGGCLLLLHLWILSPPCQLVFY